MFRCELLTIQMTNIEALQRQVSSERYCSWISGQLSLLCARIANYIRELIQNRWAPDQVLRSLGRFGPANIVRLAPKQFAAFPTLEIPREHEYKLSDSQHSLIRLFTSYSAHTLSEEEKKAFQILVDNTPLGLLCHISSESFNDQFCTDVLAEAIWRKYTQHTDQDFAKACLVKLFCNKLVYLIKFFPQQEAFFEFCKNVSSQQRMSLYFRLLNHHGSDKYRTGLHEQIVKDLQSIGLRSFGQLHVIDDRTVRVRPPTDPLINHGFMLLKKYPNTPTDFPGTVINHCSKEQILELLALSLFRKAVLFEIQNKKDLFQESFQKWGDQELYDFIRQTITERDFPPCQEAIDVLGARLKPDHPLRSGFEALLKQHQRAVRGFLGRFFKDL